MRKLKSRILKIEESNAIKNQKPVAIIIIKRGETQNEAKERHIKKNPEDKNAKIFLFDDITWRVKN
jgi:hypothetical protein